jgi:CcmD family protein
MKRYLAICLVNLLCLPTLLAQGNGSGDFMRSMGKMYVVVAVILAIFIGLVFFLVYLDRRLTKLEDQIKDHAEN